MKKSALLVTLASLAFFGCNGSKTDLLSGSWKILNLEKEGIYQQLAVSDITFKKTGKLYEVNGNSGVNTFFGTVSINDREFKASENLASTKMAGSPEAMEFEDLFLECITGANAFEVSEENGAKILKIKNESKNSVLSFVKE